MRRQRLGNLSPSSTWSFAPRLRKRPRLRRYQGTPSEDSFGLGQDMSCRAGFGSGFGFLRVPSGDYSIRFRQGPSFGTRFRVAGRSTMKRRLARSSRHLLFLALFLLVIEHLLLRVNVYCLQSSCDYSLRFRTLHSPLSFQTICFFEILLWAIFSPSDHFPSLGFAQNAMSRSCFSVDGFRSCYHMPGRESH
jgi:hypothetical protein